MTTISHTQPTFQFALFWCLYVNAFSISCKFVTSKLSILYIADVAHAFPTYIKNIETVESKRQIAGSR